MARAVDQRHDARGLAIAIGELVDDAVVDVENILRRLKQNRAAANPLPVREVVLQASVEVRSGIVYATVIVVLVFVPLFALPGSKGASSARWASPTSSRSRLRCWSP
jgi:Cu/Ag efflux pump CusA